MTTLGRAASLRVAYASAVQDAVALREENARLKATPDLLGDLGSAIDGLRFVQIQRAAREESYTPAEAEVVRLRELFREIVLLHKSDKDVRDATVDVCFAALAQKEAAQ